MRVVALLLSVDEAHRLRHSLPAIAAERPDGVLVVDDGCTDDTAAVARAHGASVLALAERRSYAAAMNAGVTRALADGAGAVLVLNADCVVEPGFLAPLVARLRAPGAERLAAVAPKLVRASGLTPDDALGEVDAAGMVVGRRRRNLLVGHGAPVAAHADPAPCFGADGAAALWRAEALRACGAAGAGEVFDETMALWATDADLAWRARLLGWEAAYEPGAVARHVRTYSPSTRAHVDPAHRRLQFRNRMLMVAKNETAAGLRRDGWALLGWEAVLLGAAVLRERELLGAYREAWALRHDVRRRRRVVQAARRVDRPPFGLAPPAWPLLDALRRQGVVAAEDEA